tara:strand:- start:1528 stop:1659 length:132 start_codon:yes stop_codon:yes gene_type:complete
MGRDDYWEKLLDNDPGYAEWRQKELEQQEQEELENEKETNNKD